MNIKRLLVIVNWQRLLNINDRAAIKANRAAQVINCKFVSLLYILLTISVLTDREPPAYFENSRDFVDKHDYSIICYPIISANYTACSAHE